MERTAPKPRLTQSQRTARTRSALLRAARELFAEHGFAKTGRDGIAERAGVTRGALYHHFATKTDVAAAVLQELEAELVDRVVTAARSGTSAYDQLHRGCRAYIDMCAEPAVARILVDAPAVLGMEACRAISAESCVRLLNAALANTAGEGIDVPGDPEIAANLLLGILNEAAALVASARAPELAREQVNLTIDEFLSRLLRPSGAR